MAQIDTSSDFLRHSSTRARRFGRAPILLASGALLGAAIALFGACSSDIETGNTGSTGTGSTGTGGTGTGGTGTGGTGTGGTTGVDCSNVGCGAPPLCSTGCQETCGCCPCGDGEVVNDPQHGPLVCNGGCYEPAMPDGGSIDASDEIDCSLVGCGPAPLCGEACSEYCGCCNCASNETFTMNGVTYKCSSGGECYEPVP